MNKVMLVLVAGLFLSAAAVADELIVTKDGKSVWATGTRKSGDNVVYTDKDSGNEKQVPSSGVEAVVPVVQRGKAYKPEEIQQNVDLLKKLVAKQPGLLRQLNELLQGWQALQKAAPEYDGMITSQINLFNSSDRSPSVYQKATLELGMIKFKDVQGAYTARIDAACEAMRKEFVATNIVRLVKMAGIQPMLVEHFVPLKRLAEPVTKAAEPAEKEKIKAMVEKARTTVYDNSIRLADSLIAGGKNVDAYLRSSAVLSLLKKEVAVTDQQKADVDKKVTALREVAAKMLSGYTLNANGFPVTDDDLGLQNKTRPFAIRTMFSSITFDEQCAMIPAANPGSLRVKQPYSMPIRLIFNSAQPANRVFGMVVMITGTSSMQTRTIKLPAVTIKNAHAEITFRDSFADFPDDFELGADRKGRSTLYIYLACQDNTQDPVKDPWEPISGAWAFRINP